MDRREYHTSEVYFSTSEASLIRMAQSYSKYTFYSTDTPEELMNLTGSYGGIEVPIF